MSDNQKQSSLQKELEADIQKINDKYKAKILQEIENKSSKSWSEYLNKSNIKDAAAVQKRVAKIVHEHVFQQLRQYAVIQFIRMEKTNSFGAMGEQRVSISFCRNLLKIPANREVNQHDADVFRKEIDQYEKMFGSPSAVKIKAMEDDFKLILLGDSYDLSQQEKINEILKYLGIPYTFDLSTFKGERTFIYGQIETKVIAGKEITISGKEMVRSPLYVLSIAAGQGAKGVMVRKESCETIFYNKWASFFDMSALERKLYQVHEYSAIREGLKEKALKYYKVKSREDIDQIKDNFIKDMIEGIFYHEVGHEIGEPPSKLDPSLAVLGNAHGVVGNDILLVLREAIADWAPFDGKTSGPLWVFLKKAQKDPEITTRLLYVYMSDNWFIDSDDEFMGMQTDILSALVLFFMNKDGSFNFESMEQGFNGIYNFLINKYAQLLQEISDVLRKATYKAGIHVINFDTLEKELHKVYLKQFPGILLDELCQKTNFWVQIFGLARKFSPETNHKIDEIINIYGRNVQSEILDKVSKGKSAEYNNSLREYVVKNMEANKVFSRANEPDIEKVVSIIAKDLKVPAAMHKKIIQKFKSILDGEAVDIAISYEGKPDPFWAVFQEILLRSGYGNIRSGMEVGEQVKPEDLPEIKKERIKDGLESIRDQIESEMYLNVKLLRVNAKLAEEEDFNRILQTISLYNDTPLKEKIQSIQFVEMKNNRLMEAYIPFKRGYIDWNTSQAVWRINQSLRSDDYLKQWTIDKLFVEAVFDEYLRSL